MNAPWLPPLAAVDFIEVVVVIVLIIIGAINKLNTMTRQGIPPRAPPPDDILQKDIDQFLRHGRSKSPGQAGRPARAG